MIDVRCTTNLDDYHRCSWPSKLACRPMIGDRVRSISNPKRSLKIVGITHGIESSDGIPFLMIELNR